jgi:trans-2,3-dihydro-3-hydroxyanthranilate isomerase
MTAHDFVLADVFTDRPFGGNQLAVFPQAEGLTTQIMQAIARELNLSETVFVFAAGGTGSSCDLRIFTPHAELPFAGHPTIGTALILDAIGALQNMPNVQAAADGARDIVLGEGVGPVPVSILRGNATARAVLSSPRIPLKIAAPPERDTLARLLGLAVGDLAAATLPAAAYSAGVPFLFIALRDRAALSRIQFDMATWTAQLKAGETPHVFAFTLEHPLTGREVDARMFAPAMGIAEDPATGAAAVALGGYLADHQQIGDGQTRWQIRQGFDMGRPSIIDLEVERRNHEVIAVRVGGSAVIMGRGTLDLP